MGDVATPDNGLANKLNSVERKFIDLLILGATTAARAYVPFLNFPVVSQLFSFFAGKFGDLMYQEMALATTFAVIDFQTSHERDAFTEAMEALRAAKTAGDPDAISKARQDAKDKFDRLVHSDGSAHP
jgi:hypothetical protein